MRGQRRPSRYVTGRVPAQSTKVEALTTQAEKGDAKSQFALGQMFYTGQGVLQHYTEAAKWFRKAAEQGDADAAARLAVMFQQGQGVKSDPAEARTAVASGSGRLVSANRRQPQDEHWGEVSQVVKLPANTLLHFTATRR